MRWLIWTYSTHLSAAGCKGAEKGDKARHWYLPRVLSPSTAEHAIHRLPELPPTQLPHPQLRQTFWGYFRVLNRQGVTIVVSSHVMDEADRCDRLGLIRSGRLLAAASPSEIRRLAGEDNLESAFLALSARQAQARQEVLR